MRYIFKLFRNVLVLSVCLFLPLVSYGQDLDSLMNLNAFTEESDLQKILNKNVSVSTQNLTTRETPGILSVITAEEIQNSGARDITDVLRLVPGFDIAQDNQFMMGLSLRGNWANEGKVLVLFDGQPMNDLLYQTVAMGNRFPVDGIERIEIIRGPGSAIYGGSAEYGVINIITKAAESLNGVALSGTAGFHSDAVGRTNGTIMAAQKFERAAWDLTVFKGNGIVSDGRYQDLYEEAEVQNLAKVSEADPTTINLGVRYGNLHFRTMYDAFTVSDPFKFTKNTSYFADVRYDWKLSQKLTLSPELRYFYQKPWQFGPRDTDEDEFRARAVRSMGQVSGSYTFSRKASLVFGGMYFHDEGTDELDQALFGSSRTIQLENYAFFAQGLFKHRLANATVGVRYEKNNRYGGAFVPRIALTKKIENFHFKVLYSQAFRAPSIQNINLALTGKVNPEKSDVFELELGYQFTPEMLLAVNAFSITTRDVLIYGLDDSNGGFAEWYENYAKSGTQGVELVYSVRKKGWYATATYSYNQAISGNTVTTYAVSDRDRQYVGMPMHKLTLNGTVYLMPKLSFNPSFIYGSERYAYGRVIRDFENNAEPVLEKLDPYVLANGFLNYRNVVPGLTVGAGAYDIFNARPAIPQAYNGGYAPIPGRSREYVLKLSYQLNFNAKK